MESLQQYRNRTAYMYDSLPHYGSICTHLRLQDKVDPAGHFRPFYGDTVFFSIPESMKKWLQGIQTMLYEMCGSCLAERIPPETFHITLHDLLNQAGEMPDGVDRTRYESLQAIEEIRQLYTSVINVRSTCMFSLVGTSIVMGFEPATDDDCAKLMAMYERFQKILLLEYPLTLHITLAYYKPGEYRDELQTLRNAM